MNRLKQRVGAVSYLPSALYTSGLAFFGMWTGMQQIHVSVPFLMIAISFVLSPVVGGPFLAYAMLALAIGLGIYGIALKLSVAWYFAAALVVALGAMVCGMTWAMTRLRPAAE